MASLNESLFNTPAAKRVLQLHKSKLDLMENFRKEKHLGDTSYERKLLAAQTLENTRRHIKAMESVGSYPMGAATQSSNVGQYKRFALDMINVFASTTIAPEIVSTQSIDNRVGAVNILQFEYGTNKGSVSQGEVFSSALGYKGMTPSYTSAAVDGETLGNPDGSGQFSLAFTPVKEGTVRVITASGTVVNAEVVDAVAGLIKAPGGSTISAGDKAYYLYDNETVPVDAPAFKMDIKSIPIQTTSRKLKAIWSFDAQYELMKEYGADMQQLLAAQATTEIQQEIDNEITLDLYNSANAGPEVTWSRVQPLGVAQSEHYDSFYTSLVEGGNQIYAATRRARANFMVCGLGVDSVLRCMRNFVAADDVNIVGPHFIGTLGNIKCYVNPNYDSNVFVLGYKGPNMMDAGYIYAPYLPITTTGMITLADDFASREGWATTYGKKLINPRLYVKGRITD